MDSTILFTKLYVPAQQPNTVPRQRLIESLERGSCCSKLILLAAPTGFGKTTLLSQWAEGRSVAWVSLEEQDSDPSRFFAYLIAALQTLHVGVGQKTLELLTPENQNKPHIVLTSLINELSTYTEPFYVVLDDYHLITNEIIHRGIEFLIEQCPPAMTIVIASRTDPPLPMAKLRVRGQVTEVRASDLRFTHEETDAFFNLIMGEALAPDEVLLLEETTEGWVAGLQLAALSMKGRTDVSSFIRAFTGGHRHILDYLAVEVLEKQSAEIQEFLLQTSILSRLSAGLCNAVTGRSDGRKMLAELERLNLFLIPLDSERHWYRYHHLFAGFLTEYLEQSDPEATATLHRRAAAWYEANDLHAEAVEHALAAEDYDTVLRLLDSTAYIMWARGELTTLVSWLEALPEDLRRSDPKLRLYHAWALVTLEELNAVEQPISLHLVERQRTSNGHDFPLESLEFTNPGLGDAMQAAAAALRGDNSRAISHSRTALTKLPEEDELLRSIISLNLGFAYREVHEYRSAITAFTEAVELGGRTDNHYVTQIATSEIAQLHLWNGNLREAHAAYTKTVEMANRVDTASLPMVCAAHMRLGLINSEWNETLVANHHLLEAIRLSKRFRKVDVQTHAYLGLAMMRRCQGDLDGALNLVGQAYNLAVDNKLIERIRIAEALRARLWVATGDLQHAIQWAWESGLSIDDEVGHKTEFEHVTLARILTEQGETEQATYLLRRIFAAAERDDRLLGRIRALMGMAMALQREGRLDESTEHLEEALALAEAQRFVYAFVEEGAPMAKLLVRVMNEREARPNTDTYSASLEYVRRLLAVFGEARVAESLKEQPLEEPLSDREMDVLLLMATGMSNREIAEELVISVGTAKWHTKNIYRKLNVHSRTQAIAHARELNILR